MNFPCDVICFLDDTDALVRKKNRLLSSSISLCPSWLPTDSWLRLVAASVLTRSTRLVRICDRFTENANDAWKQWYLSSHPETESLPEDAQTENSGGGKNESISYYW